MVRTKRTALGMVFSILAAVGVVAFGRTGFLLMAVSSAVLLVGMVWAMVDNWRHYRPEEESPGTDVRSTTSHV